MNRASSETPGVSVVIPTRDRAEMLEQCLEALFRQQDWPDGSEIVVIDDGSADATRRVVQDRRWASPVPLRYFAQPALGPAAARNLGLDHAKGRVVLFLGDDIVAHPTLVAVHAAWHTRYPSDAVAVLGFVTWSPTVIVTHYMRWLETSGEQSNYSRISGAEDVDPTQFFYTSNLSVKRGFLAGTGERFDERFRHAVLEDIDLGRRLSARGLRLKYHPGATAYHHHAIRLDSYLRRMELCGEYAPFLEMKGRRMENGAPGTAVGPPRIGLRHVRYVFSLMHVMWLVVGNWPARWVARVCEHRRTAPAVFRRAHLSAFHRGVLRNHVRRIVSRLRLVGP